MCFIITIGFSHHAIIHDSIPTLPSNHAEERQHGNTPLSEVGMYIKIEPPLDSPKHCHPHHGVDEKDEEEEGSHIEERGNGKNHSVEQCAQSLGTLNNAKDPSQSSNSKDRGPKAIVQQSNHGNSHNDRIHLVPVALPVDYRAMSCNLKDHLYEKDTGKENVQVPQGHFPLQRLIVKTRSHHSNINDDQQDNEKIKSLIRRQDKEIATDRIGWHSHDPFRFDFRHG